jgi:RNA recognition motif-containing protein
MTNIYVGNLDFATSEDELRALFGEYGAAKTVTLVTDRHRSAVGNCVRGDD